MEEALRLHLLRTARAFERATGSSLASIGKRALNDNTFFARIEAEQGFTIKTYDRVIGWLRANWPAEKAWPGEVPRSIAKPQPEGAAA
jgi:hypothetical protein